MKTKEQKLIERLKEAFYKHRDTLKLTQQEVADMLGKDIKTYQKMEAKGNGLTVIFNVLDTFHVLEIPTSEIIQLLELPPLNPSEIKNMCTDKAALKDMGENEICSYVVRQCADLDDATIATLLNILSSENLRRHKCKVPPLRRG